MTIINSNPHAQGVQQAIAINQRDMAKAMAQLTTGQRINSAADDAAVMGIVKKLWSLIGCFEMGFCF